MPDTLRPNRRVFVGRPIIRFAVVVGLLSVAAHFFLPLFVPFDPGLTVWLGITAGLTAAYSVHRFVVFRRTHYEFYDDRLVVKTGSLVSSETIDLPYRNVTQVVLRLPFIEHRLFETGHLMVHAAGSRQGIAHLVSIDDPRPLYDTIADRLRDNGFSLERTERLQREKPHLVGTLLDTSGLAVGGLLALVTIGWTIAGTIIDMMGLQSFYELYDVLVGTVDVDDPEEEATAARGTLGLALLVVVGSSAGLAKLAIHFVDLNRRTYTLWDDVVDYEDGFLTQTFKFVPVENLADTATVEPFLKRLFGMADVHLSPHGSASGIRFPSMPRAATFRRHLDRLIESTKGPSPTKLDDTSGDADVDDDTDDGHAYTAVGDRLPDVDAAPIDFGPSYIRRAVTATVDAFKLPAMLLFLAGIAYGAIHWTQFDLEHLDLPVDEIPFDLTISAALGLFALFLVWQLGKAFFFCATTGYRIGRRKMTWQRDFISRNELEFTTDKITTLVIERDLVDRLIGSATISFQSIGNATPLVFEDVAHAESKIDEIRRRLGMFADPDDAEATHRPRVNPLDVLAGRLYSRLFFLVVAAGAYVASMYWPPAVAISVGFVALALIAFVRDPIYYPRCRMWLHGDHIAMRRGIIFIERHYVPYDQIRSIATTRYPARPGGTLEVVPGSSRRVSLRYLDDPDSLHEDLDDRLHERPMRPVRQEPELDRTTVSTRRPLARNRITAAGVWTLGLTIVTVVPSLLMYLWARRTEITVEAGRLRRIQGLVYRTTQTVLTNRIDQILTNRGLLNTLFGNGIVSVLTVGSSVPELQLGPIKDEQALYDELETRLPSRRQD